MYVCIQVDVKEARKHKPSVLFLVDPCTQVCLYFEDGASAIENAITFDFVTHKSFVRVSNSTDLSAFKASEAHVVQYQGVNWAVVGTQPRAEPLQSSQGLNPGSSSHSQVPQEMWLVGLIGVFALTGTVLTITLRPIFRKPIADRRN